MRGTNSAPKLAWLGSVLLAAAAIPALAQDVPAPASQKIEIPGAELWVDARIDLRAGDVIEIAATGTLNANGQKVTPAGGRRGWLDMIRSYPLNDAGPLALIARIGETGRPFLVADKRTYEVPRPGRLYLGLNKFDTRVVNGSFQATIRFERRGPDQTETVEYALPPITSEMLEQVPRRVSDAEGTPGDNTNFVIVGDEDQILEALHAVGWVEVDRNKSDAVLAGIQAVLNRDAYLTIPMSELLLFDRVQDYGMAHAEPLSVVAQRHHFRLWRAPFDADGHQVWIGAGTHDVGFDRDQRNGSLTHRIDPEVDQERDYIGKSLQESGQVAKLDYVMPSNPSQNAKTAHGQEYRSDGRVLVIYMIPKQVPDAAKESIFPTLP